MSVEDVRNRDLFFKICFIYFANHILKIIGIQEEIIEILPTENINIQHQKPRIFNDFIDFSALTKSGKILLFEFKKRSITQQDLKQAYNYYDRIHCNKKRPVKLIIITISNKGKITEYTESDITYHPQIIKTKTINKQQDLSIIRNKFKYNIKLTPDECSLLNTLPLFKLEESEEEIIKEICENIKNKPHCIPEDELIKLIIPMYLNIKEYIRPDEQQKLMEMIKVAEKLEGIIAEIKKEGKKEGEKNIINKLIQNFTNDDKETITINKATLISMIQNK